MEPGIFVRLRRDPSTAGILLEGKRLAAGRRMVPVRLANGQERWFPYSALEPVPEEPESLLDRFAAGRFVGPDWLRRTLTRLRVTGRLSEVVYSMGATETDFYAYQFKPVIKLMNSPTDALLIADEVGLGKTIEAGLIWTELRARLDCDRLLVVCPKTLCQKWKDELDRRFGVEAQITDARGLFEALQTSRRNNKRGYALVCSMQGLRPPRGWDRNDELEGVDTGHSVRRKLARFLDEEGDGVPLIDLLVVDEAHHMRNPDTLLHCFGQLANSVASHRLFLSATPIHLRNRDLHSLLVMVDPDTFEFENTLNDLIETNAPIIAARELLLDMNTPVEEIKEKLQEAQDHEILRQNQALTQIRRELSTTSLNSSKRSELAARLERVNQLANYVTRTRRRDVEAFRVVRDPKLPVLNMSPDERHFYDEITTVVKDYAFYQDVTEPFLLSMPQRLLTSSLAAASAYWCGLANGNDEEDVEESDQDLLDKLQDDRPLVAQIAECADLLGMTELLIEDDTKYHLLVRELRQLWETDAEAKIIVFSSFKTTLHYLRNRLREDDIGVELLHGSVNRPRAQILEHFRTNDAIRVLLSSEVGSEGVDLQFSSTVVNYDLPWNPMRLEQRIGRVDRLGQTQNVVKILNLIYNDTIDKRIYDRLYERLGIGQRALGEMEAILGEPIHQMTMKLLDPRLNETQKEKIIERTALALENRRQEEDQIEAEAGSLVQHGDYILERITESRNQHRWLSGEDILIYVLDRMLQDFPGSAIDESPTGSDTYQIKLSNEGATAFQAYLNQHGIANQTRLPYPDAQHRFSFTSSVVQKNSKIEYISQLHPLVRFATTLDLNDENVRNAQAVAVKVGMEALPAECVVGLYVFLVGHWSSGSTATGSMTNVQIGYAGANVASGDLIETALAERMIAVAREHGRPIPNAAMHDGLADATTILQGVVQCELERRFEEFMDQIKAETEDRVAIRRRSLNRHFEGKIDSLEKNRMNLIERASSTSDSRRTTSLRNLVAAQEARIKKLRNTWQFRENVIDGQLAITPEWSDVCCLFMQVDTVQKTEEVSI